MGGRRGRGGDPPLQRPGDQPAGEGNTIISNWVPNGIKDPKEWPNSVQILEVTPSKQIVWALRSWDEPANFGPGTTLQLLDERGVPENGELIR